MQQTRVKENPSIDVYFLPSLVLVNLDPIKVHGIGTVC